MTNIGFGLVIKGIKIGRFILSTLDLKIVAIKTNKELIKLDNQAKISKPIIRENLIKEDPLENKFTRLWNLII